MSEISSTGSGSDGLQARIVAWVLGEASAFEASELEKLCKADPRLQAFANEVREIHDLLGEAAATSADPDWRLPDEKRQGLNHLLGADLSIGARGTLFRHRAIFVIAACVAAIAVAGVLLRPKDADLWAEHRATAASAALNSEYAAIREELEDAPDATSSFENKQEAKDQDGLTRDFRNAAEKGEEGSRPSLNRSQARGMEGFGGNAFNREGEVAVVPALGRALNPNASPSESAAVDLEALKREVRAQEEKVEERRKALTAIVRTKGIIDQGEKSFYRQSGVDESQGGRSALETHNDMEQEKMQLESQLQSLLKYDSEELRTFASGLDLPDNNVKVLFPQYMEQKRQLDTLKSGGLGDSHPTLRANEELVEAMKRELDKGVADLQETLMARKELTDERLAKVEMMKNAKREDPISLGVAAQEYVDAKRMYEQDQAKLQELKNQLIGRRITADSGFAAAETAAAATSAAQPMHSLAETDASSASLRGEAFGNGWAESELAGPAQSRLRGMPGAAGEAQNELAKRFENTAGGVSGEDSDDGRISSKPALTDATKIDSVRRGLYTAEGNYNLGKFDDAKEEYENVLRIDPYNLAARRGIERLAAARSDYFRAAYDHTRSELLSQVDSAWSLAVPSEEESQEDYKLAARGSMADVAPGVGGVADLLTEGVRSGDQAVTRNNIDALLNDPGRAKKMEATVESTLASDEPVSTFSLNVGDTSFRIARAEIAKGGRPDPAGVRVEQFYNAMDYEDPAPASGEPVAARIEQSADPVLPGRQLLRVGLVTASEGRVASQPLRLTLLIDQSGSMGRDDRRTALEKAVAEMATLLTPDDRVSVIGFARTPKLLAEGLTGGEVGKLRSLVTAAATEGGTNFEEALKLARELALRQRLEAAQNRIILFTDGAANLGNADPGRLSAQIAGLRQDGLAFDIAGMGTDELNDRLLGEMARHGNGRYHVVGADEPGDFARRVAGAFRPAAENVKVQVKFNPARVASYRLVGFAADRLKEEDFHNDAVDAAEMSAGESGVALYQVETLPDGEGEIGEVSVRFKDTRSGVMVERSWALRHDAAAPAFDKASPSMQLAGLAMMAGEKLRGGPLAEVIDFSQFSNAKAEVRQVYGRSARVMELLEMIDAID